MLLAITPAGLQKLALSRCYKQGFDTVNPFVVKIKTYEQAKNVYLSLREFEVIETKQMILSFHGKLYSPSMTKKGHAAIA